MKALALSLGLLFAVNAQAGDFDKISSVTNKTIWKGTQTFAEIKKWSDGAKNATLNMAVERFKYYPKRGEETMQAIKQLIYKYNTGWSTPESHTVRKVRRTGKSYWESTKVSLVYSALTDAQKAVFADEVESWVDMSTVDLWDVGHGNSFGSCSLILAHDKRNQEMITFGSCFSE